MTAYQPMPIEDFHQLMQDAKAKIGEYAVDHVPPQDLGKLLKMARIDEMEKKRRMEEETKVQEEEIRRLEVVVPRLEDFHQLMLDAKAKIGEYAVDHVPPQDLGKLLKMTRIDEMEKKRRMEEETKAQEEEIRRLEVVEPHIEKMRNLYQFLISSTPKSKKVSKDSHRAFKSAGYTLAWAYKTMMKEAGIISQDNGEVNDLLTKIRLI